MKTLKKRYSILTTLAAAVLLVGGCTSSGDVVASGSDEIYDPLENTNRRVFAFNKGVDKAVIHPVAKGYNYIPAPARNGVTNFLRNLRSPVNFANQVLQGDAQGASDVLVRAAVNTTVGVGGLFDVAGYEGIPYEAEDFGQTLATWGVDHGPYLVVPIIGPASVRDYAGFIVDSYADPLRFYLFNIDEEGLYYSRLGAEYLSLRASLVDVLEDLEDSSIDYYAATRSAYYQRRAALVNDQDADSAVSPAIPDYDDF